MDRKTQIASARERNFSDVRDWHTRAQLVAANAVGDLLAEAAHGAAVDPEQLVTLIELVHEAYFSRQLERIALRFDEALLEYVRFCSERRLIRLVFGPNQLVGRSLDELRSRIARRLANPATPPDQAASLILGDVPSRYRDLFTCAPVRLDKLVDRPGYIRARVCLEHQRAPDFSYLDELGFDQSLDELVDAGRDFSDAESSLADLRDLTDPDDRIALDEFLPDELEPEGRGLQGRGLVDFVSRLVGESRREILARAARAPRRCLHCGTMYVANAYGCPFCPPAPAARPESAHPAPAQRRTAPPPAVVRRRGGETVRLDQQLTPSNQYEETLASPPPPLRKIPRPRVAAGQVPLPILPLVNVGGRLVHEAQADDLRSLLAARSARRVHRRTRPLSAAPEPSSFHGSVGTADATA